MPKLWAVDRNFSHGDTPGAPIAADVPQPALWPEDTRPTIVPLGMDYDGGLDAAMTQDANALNQVVLASPDNKGTEANVTGVMGVDDTPAKPSESPDSGDRIVPPEVTQSIDRVGAELIRHAGGIVSVADDSVDKAEGAATQPYAEGSPAEVKEAPNQELSPRQRVIEAVRTETTYKERHPNAPDVEVVFRFDPHHSAADFKQLPETLDGAHVYLC